MTNTRKPTLQFRADLGETVTATLTDKVWIITCEGCPEMNTLQRTRHGAVRIAHRHAVSHGQFTADNRPLYND